MIKRLMIKTQLSARGLLAGAVLTSAALMVACALAVPHHARLLGWLQDFLR